MEDTSLGNDGLKAIFKTLKATDSCCHLETLSVAFNDLDADGLEDFDSMLGTKPRLAVLNMEGNPLGYDGAELVSEALRVNAKTLGASLTSLNLCE